MSLVYPSQLKASYYFSQIRCDTIRNQDVLVWLVWLYFPVATRGTLHQDHCLCLKPKLLNEKGTKSQWKWFIERKKTSNTAQSIQWPSLCMYYIRLIKRLAAVFYYKAQHATSAHGRSLTASLTNTRSTRFSSCTEAEWSLQRKINSCYIETLYINTHTAVDNGKKND